MMTAATESHQFVAHRGQVVNLLKNILIVVVLVWSGQAVGEALACPV